MWGQGPYPAIKVLDFRGISRCVVLEHHPLSSGGFRAQATFLVFFDSGDLELLLVNSARELPPWPSSKSEALNSMQRRLWQVRRSKTSLPPLPPGGAGPKSGPNTSLTYQHQVLRPLQTHPQPLAPLPPNALGPDPALQSKSRPGRGHASPRAADSTRRRETSRLFPTGPWAPAHRPSPRPA